MGLLDSIIGWVFSPKYGVCCGAFLAGAFFFLFSPCSVVQRSSQGRFSFLFLRHFLRNGHIWSKKVISGPDFLKNDDIWSDLIKLAMVADSPASYLSNS